jgi:hypothetical protein
MTTLDEIRARASAYSMQAQADLAFLLGEVERLQKALAAQRESVHPWQAFLEARADAIDWLHADGKTDAEIAKTLSMDGPVQVYLIRTRHRASAIKGEPG